MVECLWRVTPEKKESVVNDETITANRMTEFYPEEWVTNLESNTEASRIFWGSFAPNVDIPFMVEKMRKDIQVSKGVSLEPDVKYYFYQDHQRTKIFEIIGSWEGLSSGQETNSHKLVHEIL